MTVQKAVSLEDLEKALQKRPEILVDPVGKFAERRIWVDAKAYNEWVVEFGEMLQAYRSNLETWRVLIIKQLDEVRTTDEPWFNGYRHGLEQALKNIDTLLFSGVVVGSEQKKETEP